MRETELWTRLTRHLGPAYAEVWADQTSVAELGNRTVREALRAGVPVKSIWRAVWALLELPASER